MEENLKKLEIFFNNDLKVKKILHELEPKESYKYNNDSCIEYGNKLYKSIEDIAFYIIQIANKFFPNEEQYCKNYFTALKSELLKVGYDFNKLSHFYNICLANMSEEFVNKVGENCVGYTIFSGVSFNEAKSINELLHLMHQSVINNEYVLHSMPKLDAKNNEFGYSITLYGVEKDLSKCIFDNFPLDMDCGWTDIVSLENKIIMMVRDRGHALSIEIEKENDKYYIKYFIPKICNVDMVNNLRGVTKVDNNSKYTVGIIQTIEENLPLELYDFISKVPMDSDMVLSNFKL